MSTKPNYWNHNTAYYKWIKKCAEGCDRILDVGCGDGGLAFFLEEEYNHIVGIDPYDKYIEEKSAGTVSFVCSDFENYSPESEFDAVVFVASLHHMDMERSLAKAKNILNDGGKLLIVGLAKPSSIPDKIIEVLRVVPSFLISSFKRIKPCEDAGIPVSFDMPTMCEVRKTVRKELPDAKIRRALHYRYLLEWDKTNANNT